MTTDDPTDPREAGERGSPRVERLGMTRLVTALVEFGGGPGALLKPSWYLLPLGLTYLSLNWYMPALISEADIRYFEGIPQVILILLAYLGAIAFVRGTFRFVWLCASRTASIVRKRRDP